MNLHFITNVQLKNIIGKDLINNDNIAILELVKNAFDANAKRTDISFVNLENFYISVVIYSKSILYKIHVASKKQIRNKTVFFDNSVFFSFHLISFFALGNI